MVTNEIEDQVVTFGPIGEILFGIINHVIGSDGTDKIDIARAANAGHFCAERFRDLHRESANASGRAVHQDLLTGLNVAFVAETLQRGDSRDWNRSRFFEYDVVGLGRDGAVRQNANVLGKRAGLSTEHFVTGFEIGYIFADGFNGSGVIDTDARLLGLAQSRDGTQRQRTGDREVERINRNRVDLY